MSLSLAPCFKLFSNSEIVTQNIFLFPNEYPPSAQTELTTPSLSLSAFLPHTFSFFLSYIFYLSLSLSNTHFLSFSLFFSLFAFLPHTFLSLKHFLLSFSLSFSLSLSDSIFFRKSPSFNLSNMIPSNEWQNVCGTTSCTDCSFHQTHPKTLLLLLKPFRSPKASDCIRKILSQSLSDKFTSL